MIADFNTFRENPSIDEETGRCNVAYMRDEALRFMIDMGSSTAPARWLTMTGPPATGKTMLARIAKRFHAKHLDAFQDERFDPKHEVRYRRGIFASWVEVVQSMLSGDYTGIRDMKEAWLLVLDDIGTEYLKTRELATSKLYEILNAREGLWTIITANLTLQQISDQMDQRIASRLLRGGSVVVDVNAIDYNLRQ